MDKNLDYVLQGKEKSIGSDTVWQPLPHKDFRFANPFIVLHHLRKTYSPGSNAERLHAHPHRGFSPVTFMFSGEGFHKDSEGNSGVLKEGEVQWMFSGSGILHSEGPSPEFLKKGGQYEFIQLWINVPARYKMQKPAYQHAPGTAMPSISAEEGIDLKLASGEVGTHKGPLRSYTPVTAVFGSMKAHSPFEFTAPENGWTLLYILEGSLQVNSQEVPERHLVVFSREGTDIRLFASQDSRLLYLTGEPIDEPVAARGNFVMNTEEEINQAEMDFADGKYGKLDD
jgi:redox-sensitive bicupin YhaK (pirin superfamily)